MSRCPIDYWEPGLGPCICEGRVHKTLKDALDWYDAHGANLGTHVDNMAKAARLVANPTLTDFLADAVTIDGGHHKQWYLEELATHLGIDLPDHEPGIAP